MKDLGLNIKFKNYLMQQRTTGKITFEDFNEVVTDLLSGDLHEELLKEFKVPSDDESGKISFRNFWCDARELDKSRLVRKPGQ